MPMCSVGGADNPAPMRASTQGYLKKLRLLPTTLYPVRTYNILFLCTHNSARSIIGEALASTQTRGRFIGYSAGASPSGHVHPMARELAAEMGYPAEMLSSKSWNEFTLDNAPQMDFIITVCDNAASEACPVWIGHPATAHWGFPDPAQVQGTEEEKRKVFKEVMLGLKRRLELLAAMPLEQLDHMSIQARMRELANA